MNFQTPAVVDASQRALQHFLRRSISLLLMLVQPTASRIGLPSWSLVALFAAYNGLVGLVWTCWPRRMCFARVAVLDLLAAGVLYFGGNQAGGPLFVLFFLAVDSAVAGLSLRGILLYTLLGAQTDLAPATRFRPDRGSIV